jgi:hypothetical protein
MAKLALASDQDVGQVRRPRIITALGKQRSGKSMFIRYYIERGASDRYRPLKMVDADPHNDTLHQHYPEAFTPGSTGIEDRRISLEQCIRQQMAETASPYDAIWDLGGGDLLMSRLAQDVQFTETVERIGIDLIVFYMLSPSLSDLEYFRSLEEAGFRPKRLGLVFNAGLIQGDRVPERAFDAMLADPLIKTLGERGARPMFMPALASDCVEAVEGTKSHTYRAAITQVGMWHEMRLTTWLDDKMEKNIANPLLDLGWLV